jgi:hypothetical protein
MRFVLFSISFFIAPYSADANIPILVEPQEQYQVIHIDEPDVSQAFYGTLKDAPHTFEITPAEQLNLFVEIQVPNTSFAHNNVSGIIVRQLTEGGVEEVARLHARDASWESFFEPLSGDSYRRGPRYEGEISPGTYFIEVSTPDNREPYVLIVGTKEDRTHIGYFETIARIAQVKVFFDKSQFTVVQSPFVYVPLGLLMAGMFLVHRMRRRWYSTV